MVIRKNGTIAYMEDIEIDKHLASRWMHVWINGAIQRKLYNTDRIDYAIILMKLNRGDLINPNYINRY